MATRVSIDETRRRAKDRLRGADEIRRVAVSREETLSRGLLDEQLHCCSRSIRISLARRLPAAFSGKDVSVSGTAFRPRSRPQLLDRLMAGG